MKGKVQCPICYNSYVNLNSHLRIHSQDKKDQWIEELKRKANVNRLVRKFGTVSTTVYQTICYIDDCGELIATHLKDELKKGELYRLKLSHLEERHKPLYTGIEMRQMKNSIEIKMRLPEHLRKEWEQLMKVKENI